MKKYFGDVDPGETYKTKLLFFINELRKLDKNFQQAYLADFEKKKDLRPGWVLINSGLDNVVPPIDSDIDNLDKKEDKRGGKSKRRTRYNKKTKRTRRNKKLLHYFV